MLNKKALAGAPSTPPAFVEDVFSTYLYTGNSSTQTITNNIDLSTKGGLVWIKDRTAGGGNHGLVDTARGFRSYLSSDNTGAAYTNVQGYDVTAFNTTGFSLGPSQAVSTNDTGVTYASWTFRKQAKFFDVVTYTGNGSNRTISHNLGSVPGVIIVKRTDSTGNWIVYHRSLGATKYMVLEVTDSVYTFSTYWNDTEPTSTVFTVGTSPTVNTNGGTYVAYLFAHDAGGFGTAGTDNVISCGSFTGSSTSADITLGYEPQWILYKQSNGTAQWNIVDNMRGLPATPAANNYAKGLFPNTSGAEDNRDDIAPTATGFKTLSNSASNTYIYIAIRRGPMKTPTSGTSVYNAIARTGTGAAATITGVGFPPDAVWGRRKDANYGRNFDRLRGPNVSLPPAASAAEANPSNSLISYDMNGFSVGSDLSEHINASSISYIYWNFRRAPSFFDEVCYTGTGSNTTFTHNLGVVPELMIVKRRSTSNDWAVYANNDNTDYLVLNTTAATADDNTYWNDTTPTASVFSVGTNNAVNASASTYVAYLFATCAGVSKVGSYTGTATTKQIDCGFTAGARFVLIKRTDSTGDWYVWDSTRGIVAGNDPYLLLNEPAAEVTNTDYIDPVNSGFEISSTAPAAINANGGSFIFMAIA